MEMLAVLSIFVTLGVIIAFQEKRSRAERESYKEARAAWARAEVTSRIKGIVEHLVKKECLK